MSNAPRRALVLGLAGALTMGVAACGSSSSDSSSSSSSSSSSAATDAISLVKAGKYYNGIPAAGQKKGGTLKVLQSENFEHVDPGAMYFQIDYMLGTIVHRQLYTYKPNDPTKAIPDIAASDPVVSKDEKTVTVKLRDNVMFSPPVNRAVTSSDIKYAFERGLKPSVANGYEGAYFGAVKGLTASKGGNIPGIETPDKTTLIFKLTKPQGATLARALALPLTSPVPEEYAKGFDAKTPSTYDQDPTKQAFTGPYMIKSYQSGRSLQLVRNPNWNGAASGDPRPAYLNEIDWSVGGDANVIGRQVASGTNVLQTDTVPPAILKEFATKTPQQLTFTALGNRYVALNTQKKPFNNINVRKAVAAVLDRTAMRQTRGGPLTGVIATHFLYPGGPGYEQAGGAAGTGADFLKNPSGDLALAEKYMKAAGFPSGKYTGPPLTVVASSEQPARNTSLVVQNSLEKLGFKVNLRSVGHSTMYSKFCNVPQAMKSVDVCPSYGWLPDFSDAQPMLDPTFNGENIVPTNNSNPSLFNDKTINAALDKASQLTDQNQRNAAFGAIDKQITDQVPAVPWLWDTLAAIQGKDVHGVSALWNSAWDLSYTSLDTP